MALKRVLRDALIALAGAISAAIAVAIFSEPLQLRVIPTVMSWLDRGESLHIYDPARADSLRLAGDAGGADAEYSLYLFGMGSERVGRMIARENGGDNFDKQWLVRTVERDDLIVLTYRPADDRLAGAGVMVAHRQRTANAYVGSLFGIARPSSGTGRCRMDSFVAVYRSSRDIGRFVDLAEAAIRRGRPQLVLSAEADLAGAQWPCGTPP